MKRKLLALLLSVAMVLSLLPGYAFAGTERTEDLRSVSVEKSGDTPDVSESEDLSGETSADHAHSLHTGSEETVTFTKVLTSADMVPQYGKVTLTDGAYALGEDISLANVAGLNIEGSVTLCLAGYDLDMGANYIGFSGSNSTLRICDCAKEDKGEIRSTSGSGVVLIYGKHTLELYETLLSGTSYAVNNQGGQVKVYGATLSAVNPADRGYAYTLLANGGTVTLEGSTLIGESETVYTLNVMNGCVVSMKDSTVIAKAKNAYAVLLSDGVEATAVGCNLRSEGAVDGGTVFALNGGGNLTAEDTTFVAQGNGSSIFGINTFSGSTVSLTDCTVTADSQNTGTTTAMGINNGGKALILKNTDVTSKGAEGRYSFGIYGSGTLSVEDCTVISEGTGEFVYGIYAVNNAELQGEITVNGTTSDIALSNGKYIVLTGELTGGDTYSVYTYEEPTATAPQLIVKGWDEFGTEINPFYPVNADYSICDMDGDLYLTDFHVHSLHTGSEETVTFTKVLTSSEMVPQYGKVTLTDGAYVLGEDISLANVAGLNIEGSVTLCLAGYDLDMGANYIGFSGSNSTLRICDCAVEDKGEIRSTSGSGVVLIYGKHTLELYETLLSGTSYAVNNQGGQVKVYGATLSAVNPADRGYAYTLLANGGTVTLEGSTLIGESETVYTLNVMNGCVVSMKDSTVIAKAKNAYAVLLSDGVEATAVGCNLRSEGTVDGGTVFALNGSGNLTAEDTIFVAKGNGSSIFGINTFSSSTVSLTDCTVTADSQNTGSTTAMGINNSGKSMTLKNTTVTSKGAEGRYSFGIYGSGALSVEDCTVISEGTGEFVYGIYAANNVELQGEIIANGTTSDIALSNGKYIVLKGELTGGDTYSVYTYEEPTATAPQLIVKGWEEFGTEINPFYPVNADYSICDMDGDLYLTDFHVHSLHTGSEETVTFTKVLTSADMVPQYGKVTLTDGAYVLGEDISLANVAGLNIEGSVTLCLAGHDLDMGSNYIGFSGSNSTLRICDCAVEDKGEIRSTSGSGVVLIYGKHTLELYETLLSGTSYAVNNQGGQVKVYGATLSAVNSADRGYAYTLLANGGTVTLEGSTLIGEAETVYTLNVMNSCVVSMKDSTVIAKAKNAYAVLLSDGVEATAVGCDLRSEGTVDGGTVFALNGGGNLTAEDTTFVAQGNGSSIFGINTFSGSTVSLIDCTVTADSQNTGSTTAMGINNSGKSMTLKNTDVTSKGAEGRYSFGIYSSGALSVEDCTVISEGTGEFVYGIYAANNVELQGEIIANGTTSDIALSNGKYIVLTGELTGGDTYSVYTYEEPTATAPQLIVKGWDTYGSEINPFYSAVDGFAVEEKENAEGQKELYMVVSDYEITVEETVGGKLIVSEETALPGNEITIQATAESGYLLQKLVAVYTNKAGEEIALPITSHPEDGKPIYTFTMPEGNVTLKATFEQKTLKFRSISLSLESSIAMNFYVAESSLTDYTDIYILVEKELYDAVGNLLEERATEILVECENIPVGGVDSRHYIYSDITSKEMSSKVYATIYATVNGILIAGETREYSVVQYATNMIQKYQSTALKTLLVDLLNYGTLAQQVFGYNNKAENYANASEIVQSAQIYATQTTPEILSYATNDKGNGKDLPTTIPGISLNLEDRVEINFYVKENAEKAVEELQLVVTYENQKGEAVREVIPSDRFTYDPQSKYYRVTFDSLNATEMRTVITVCLEDGQGQVMSNIRTYSIESYAASAMNNAAASELMKELIVAMMKYGDATASYFYGT